MFADSLRAGSGRMLTALEEDQDVCWQLASRIRTFADSLQGGSGSQAVKKPVWHISLLCVQWKTTDDGQRNCPKHVEFYSKNNFEKLVHLVGFIIRIALWFNVQSVEVWKRERKLPESYFYKYFPSHVSDHVEIAWHFSKIHIIKIARQLRGCNLLREAILVVARSKTWLCGRTLAGITGSKPAKGLYVSLSPSGE